MLSPNLLSAPMACHIWTTLRLLLCFSTLTAMQYESITTVLLVAILYICTKICPMYEINAPGLFLSFFDKILTSVLGLCFSIPALSIKKSSLAESDCLLIKVTLSLTGKSLNNAYIKFKNPRNIAIAKVILFLKPFSYLINIVFS